MLRNMKIMLELRLFFAKIQSSAQTSPLSKNGVPENERSKTDDPACQKSASATFFFAKNLHRGQTLHSAIRLSLSVIFSADWLMFSIKRRFRTTSLSLFVHIRPGTAHGKASQGILRLAGRNTAVQSAARVLTPRRTENRIVFPLPAPSECSQTVAVFSLHQNSPPPYGKRAVGFSFLLAAGQSLSMGRPWPQSAGNNGSSRSPG